MRHHIINESHQRENCPYCKTPLHNKSWISKFWAEIHYKIFKCNCGKDVSIRMPFNGSGHDSWTPIENKDTPEEKMKTLEQEIEITKETVHPKKL